MARRLRTLLALWGPVPAYMLVVLAVSVWTVPKSPLGQGSDKLFHAVEFFGLSFLLGRALALQFRRAPRWEVIVCALSFSVGVAALDELLQSYAPLRTSDWADVCADALGAASAAIVSAWWYRRPALAGEATGIESA